MWQPYEDEYKNLPPWCVAGRAVWTAIVPLVCFHLVEKHTPDRVVRQFGMIQEIPHHVNTDPVLHAIDLKGKVGVDWMRRHAMHIRSGVIAFNGVVKQCLVICLHSTSTSVGSKG